MFCAIVFLTNLGSIKCPSVYHHLNNYGSSSIMAAIGTIRKAEKIAEDGSREIRGVVDIGFTLDERIAASRAFGAGRPKVSQEHRAQAEQ